MPIAVHRSYVDGGRLAKNVRRLHILREEGEWAGKQSLCGQAMWSGSRSGPVIYNPMPATPPNGLAWCPLCVGRLAERLGVLAEIASSLAAKGATTCP